MDCIIADEECLVTDNLIQTFLAVPTVAECQALCKSNQSTCAAFNWFGPDSAFYPQEACLLLSSCGTRVESAGCYRGAEQSDEKCRCSIGFHGAIDQNSLVGLVANVETEAACKQACAVVGECEVYTYYGNSSLVEANLCFLLRGFLAPVAPCTSCTTGPATCGLGGTCKVAVLTAATGQPATGGILAEASLNISLVTEENSCRVELAVVAVGGGGAGEGTSTHGGGGGSGYIQAAIIPLTSGSLLEVTVGGAGGNTSVGVGGQVLLLAEAGESATLGHAGGDGYSGGGGYSGGAGGQGGGDGTNGNQGKGGRGSGFLLSTLQMDNFVLKEGAGGNVSTVGGGGGGVVVVNAGQRPEGGGPYDGQGFGAGGAGGEGLPGCVLIEIQ